MFVEILLFGRIISTQKAVEEAYAPDQTYESRAAVINKGTLPPEQRTPRDYLGYRARHPRAAGTHAGEDCQCLRSRRRGPLPKSEYGALSEGERRLSYLRYIKAYAESDAARWEAEIESNTFTFGQWVELVNAFAASEREAAKHLNAALRASRSLPEEERRLLQEAWFRRERLRDIIEEALEALQCREEKDASAEVNPLHTDWGVVTPDNAGEWFASALSSSLSTIAKFRPLRPKL